MDNLLSNGEFHQTVPEQFVLPPEKLMAGEVGPTVSPPVIDLRGGPHCHVEDRDKLIGEIISAGEEFGFFQVINHGVSEQVMGDIMGITEEFFNMPKEHKAAYYTEDTSKINCLFSSTNCGIDGPGYWRETLRLECYPVPETINEWPDKPTKLRDVLEKFIAETKELSVMLLSLIYEGLGLKKDFEGDFSSGRIQLNVYSYLPAAEPNNLLSLPPHCDRNMMNFLLQGGANSLKIMHHGRWVGVELIANAFLVNVGHRLEIFRNDELESAEDRVITNSGTPGMPLAMFIAPALESFICLEKEIVNEENPPHYEPSHSTFFLRICTDRSAKRVDVWEYFKMNG